MFYICMHIRCTTSTYHENLLLLLALMDYIQLQAPATDYTSAKHTLTTELCTPTKPIQDHVMLSSSVQVIIRYTKYA